MHCRRRAWVRAAGGLMLATALPTLGGCALPLFFPRETRVPIDTSFHAGPCAGTDAPRALLVLLPGAYSQPSEFVDAGFVRAVEQRGLAADLLLVDAHIGYYNNGSVLQRLHEDVIGPARARGVQTIWLVGISLGGLGALGYAMQHGSAIDGVLVIAPYLGRRTLVRDVQNAGSLARWRAGAQPRDDQDRDFALWAWLAEREQQPQLPPPIYLGYGEDDRFAGAHRVLAAALPSDRRHSVPGGHDWPPWTALFEHWLDRGLLPTACAAAARPA
jgi:pimeloyl-ACP methyl ester carboxylesterase